MSRVLVTGATGFVGRALCGELLRHGHVVCAALRCVEDSTRMALEEVETIAVGEVNAATDWRKALAGCEAVVHLAARVHVMREEATDPLAEFRAVNAFGTENLARQAAATGVRRFVCVSTIKVNGDCTPPDAAFTEADLHLPKDPYGVSKSEAELALHRVARETGMEIVIVRPPLVYGPGVKGNFLTMLKALRRGIPMPFGAVSNRRSLVYLENLADALVLCATHPAATGETYLVSDGEDISTPELLRKLCEPLGVPLRLLPVPASVLRIGGTILGKSGAFERLLGSLIVDSSKIRLELGWTPPFTLTDGLRKTAEWFKSNNV